MIRKWLWGERKLPRKKCTAVNCPLNGNCLVEGLVYKAVVGFIKGQENVYIDSSEVPFDESKRDIISTNLPLSNQGINTIQNMVVIYEKWRKTYQRICVLIIGNKMCKSWQDEKLAIILYLDQYKLLNERSEVYDSVQACYEIPPRHLNSQF